ncbi:MAG TPA: polymorphic toxin-type HINT domain-containing protein [Lacipirellulaceae bacterium]|nr:polymorphic toxin-type HINT domain-containing protein [Lacipirellulaceae bacterium]
MASEFARRRRGVLFSWMSRLNWIVLVGAAALAGEARGATGDATQERVAILNTAAAQADIAGDVTRSHTLLHEAIQIDPDNQLAHWQLGQLNVDGKWLTVEESQRRAAADPRQAEYCDLRKTMGEMGDGPQGELALARWCRKNNLNDEAQFHWASVLNANPTNEEALRALNLRWQRGRLVSREQVAQDRDKASAARHASERWTSKLVKWRRAVSGHDAVAREATLAEIRLIKDVDSIPALEDVTLGRDARKPQHADECNLIAMAFLEALGKNPGQASTDSLARHAVFAPADNVRTSAIEKLKSRDRNDYLPMLLAGLGMPLESSFRIDTGPDGSVHYSQSLYREGAESDWSLDSRSAAVQTDFGGRVYTYDAKSNTFAIGPPAGSFPSEVAKKHRVALRYQIRFGKAAIATESQVANLNQAIEAINKRIIPVLTATTDKDFGDRPKAWWDWWRQENEYYTSPDHPVDRHYYSSTATYDYNFPVYQGYPVLPPRTSCFVKGTPVWTKLGIRPIETLEPGDLVLSQNVDTGELKYEPVLALTLRPPSEILNISLSREVLGATRGHPFWVAGTGWRMSKELHDGTMLHSISGTTSIRSIKTNGEAEAYNLVVAEFSTYFVGERGLLVHDNMPRSPTRAIAPGVVASR